MRAREPTSAAPAAAGEAGPRLRIEGGLDERSGDLPAHTFSSFRAAGRSFSTSATNPTWATSKIGAVGSVLIAMMRPASFIPATCCIAPLTPHAT